jgi:hypothetical protein
MRPRAPLRVCAPLRPVIGRRDRPGPRIRGRAPLTLFWRRRKHARGSGPPQPSHMASWSLSLSLLQKIVLGLREPARREAGAKAPPVPTASAVAAWRRSARTEALRKLSIHPARQLWGLLPVAPLAAATTRTLGRRAAPMLVAAMSPNRSAIGRLIGTPSAFRRASAGSSLSRGESRDRLHPRGVAGSPLALTGGPKAEALPARFARRPSGSARQASVPLRLDPPARPAPRRSTSAPHASALRRLDPPAAAARIDASPALRTADRPIVTVVYRRREVLVGDAPAPGRRRAAELVWPAVPRARVQTGLPSLALAPFTAVAREAPVAAVAARIAAAAPAAPPTLPDLDGLVDEVMRRIDRRFRSERLRRGL